MQKIKEWLKKFAAWVVPLVKNSAAWVVPWRVVRRAPQVEWPPYPEYVTPEGVRTTDGYEVAHWQVQLRQTLAKTTPHFGFGQCACCGLPWWLVLGHNVMYSKSAGCFAICEMCFQDLGTEEALPFYIAALQSWRAADQTMMSAEALEQAETYLRSQMDISGVVPRPDDDKWWEIRP
jgi:hypothetical protein